MTHTRLWDRAALAIASDGLRRPEIVSLPVGELTVQDLFDFMRDAELRFTTLRMRIHETAKTARGDEETEYDVVVRHPGDAKVTTSRPGEIVGGQYEIWISDGEVVRTYVSTHKLGTQRPIRNRPRGLHDPDLPGFSRVYEPVTALPMETLPDTFIHPAGYCQNVLVTGAVSLGGEDDVDGRAALVLDCAHPRTVEVVGDRPDFSISIAVDRDTGVIVRLIERIGGEVTRHAEVRDLQPDAPLPPSAFTFTFPTGTTVIY